MSRFTESYFIGHNGIVCVYSLDTELLALANIDHIQIQKKLFG